jgi:RND family efflux transporter MFP subunit
LPLEVSVSAPVEREVTDYEDFTGRTDAVISVEIRPRVTGYLTKVAFKEGDIIKKDALLYVVDPRPYKDAVDQAAGDLQRLRGQQILDDAQVARYEKLVPKGAASQQDLDVQRGAQAENLGSIEAAKANLARQQLNLEWCTIQAPVTGKVSRTFFQIGNLVTADTTVLTTLVTIDPMYAYFNVEEVTLLRVMKQVREGTFGNRKLDSIEVRMGLADDVGRQFPFQGHLNFLNNAVDPLTGTITVRGVFPNADQKLVPGLFARVRVYMGVSHKALLVNERAIGTDQGQKFLYVLDANNKARYQRIKTGQVHDGLRVVEEGLSAGDRIVVNGLQRVRPGLVVKPETVDMMTLGGTVTGKSTDATAKLPPARMVRPDVLLKRDSAKKARAEPGTPSKAESAEPPKSGSGVNPASPAPAKAPTPETRL